jgi:hypothetical protein
MSNREAVSSADSPGAPGSKGLMLGDILGRRAGETCTEPVDRFLLARGAIFGIFRAVGQVEPGCIKGLWFAEVVPGRLKTGDDSGCNEAGLAELLSSRECPCGAV